jgi:hypothetical protein
MPGTSSGVRSYSSLSVKDLLDARDAYHVLLSNMDNVIATAIGLFRFRPGDKARVGTRTAPKEKPPRTLANSVVNEKSRPSVLVFIKKWESIKTIDPRHLVPRHLYLADGRVVPTCVILAEKDDLPDRRMRPVQYPRSWIGGGYPVLTDVQDETRFGTLACLATDGELNFALTARHVAGREGQVAETVLGGVRQRVGVSDRVQTRKLGFSEVYPGWSGTHCLLNLDVGLIRVDSIHDWTAQVFGLGILDEPVNLTPENISLDLIGEPVRAHGAGCGQLEGEVQALFYRYESVGGIDFVADVVIGPRKGNEGFEIGRAHV